jgi:hypothetical protein
MKTERMILTACMLLTLLLSGSLVVAQAPAVPTPDELAQALGFSQAEIGLIKGGEIVTKPLKGESDKELAGVVAVLFKRPVGEVVAGAMQGKMLETDKKIRAFHGWQPDESADKAFADLRLSASDAEEAALFADASAGSKLNLSKAEIRHFKGVNPDPVTVSIALREMLKARYESYRKSGLAGIAPYARGWFKESSPSKELSLAIHETMTAARRPDYFQALLSYPASQPASVEHRFYWFNRTVENRPTFILAHRAEIHSADAALLTEEQFYVGHSYNANFVAGGCLAVQGGTLVFYVNRTFTDQVTGWMGGLKQEIGRTEMLSDIAANLRRVREQLKK